MNDISQFVTGKCCVHLVIQKIERILVSWLARNKIPFLVCPLIFIISSLPLSQADIQMKSISALLTIFNFCCKAIDPSVTLAPKIHLSECTEIFDARIKNDKLHYAKSSSQEIKDWQEIIFSLVVVSLVV